MPAESLGERNGLFLASKFNAENGSRGGAVSEQGWFDFVTIKPLPHLLHAFGESRAFIRCADLYRKHHFLLPVWCPYRDISLAPARSIDGQSSDTDPANSSANSAASASCSNCARISVPDPEITYSKVLGRYPRPLSHTCITFMMSGSAIPRDRK